MPKPSIFKINPSRIELLNRLDHLTNNFRPAQTIQRITISQPLT